MREISSSPSEASQGHTCLSTTTQMVLFISFFSNKNILPDVTFLSSWLSSVLSFTQNSVPTPELQKYQFHAAHRNKARAICDTGYSVELFKIHTDSLQRNVTRSTFRVQGTPNEVNAVWGGMNCRNCVLQDTETFLSFLLTFLFISSYLSSFFLCSFISLSLCSCFLFRPSFLLVLGKQLGR